MMTNNYIEAGIPKRHRDFRPKDNADEKWASNYEELKELVLNGAIIVLLGNRGTGKTQLAACLLGYITQDNKKTGLYTKAFDAFLTIREGMKISSEKKAVERYVNPYILVIDAFEVKADTQFEARVLDHIVDKRYDDMKTTIIITNESLEAFGKKIGQSNLDRINETGIIKELKGVSKR